MSKGDVQVEPGLVFTHKTKPGKFKVTSCTLGYIYYRVIKEDGSLGVFDSVLFEEFARDHFKGRG